MNTSSAENSILAEGRHVRLRTVAGWEYVERRHVEHTVMVVAVTASDCLLLVEQYRKPVGCRVLELPAGLTGDTDEYRGEDPCVTAHRELLEETGYEAETMQYISRGPTSAGLSNEVVNLYVAGGLHKTGPGGGDASEDITVHEVPLDDVCAWLKQQENQHKLIDPKIYAGLYFARQR